MRNRPDDPMDPNALPADDPTRALNRAALARAVQSLRYLSEFHTIDIVRHPVVMNAHRELLELSDFAEHIASWLKREALFLGLRGPLPGQTARGSRWAWLSAVADPTGGKGQA